MVRHLFLVVLILQMVGCSGHLQSSKPDLYQGLTQPQIELTDTPFYPQERYQCGPAALAMALGAVGSDVSPDALVAQVYLPARQGSLQPEMLATSRRHGYIPYIIEPTLTDLFDSLASGYPVVVLQNLGLSWIPRWHYAVVIGIDSETGTVTLRSGTRKRHQTDIQTFERTWARSGYWGFIVLPPGQLPDHLQQTRYIEAVAPLERLQNWSALERAWQAGLSRWPDIPVMRLGLANAYYGQSNIDAAIDELDRLLASQPDFAAAHNNLAELWRIKGEMEKARRHATLAVASEPGNPIYRETLDSLER